MPRNESVTVLIRDEEGNTVEHRIPELAYRFTEGGVIFEHVNTTPEGVWVYVARPY